MCIRQFCGLWQSCSGKIDQTGKACFLMPELYDGGHRRRSITHAHNVGRLVNGAFNENHHAHSRVFNVRHALAYAGRDIQEFRFEPFEFVAVRFVVQG